MFFDFVLLIFSLIGSLGARQANLDINRLYRLPNKEHNFYSPYIQHRSLDSDKYRRSNDYDDSSSGLSEPRTPLHILYPAQTSHPKNAIKIHQPREDPKLYYQSDAYLKEINFKNINHEVTGVYPGREVVRASEYEPPRIRKSRRENRNDKVNEKCILCPLGRTLVTKMGSDRVVLQTPRLFTCSGHRAPSNVKLVHMYGPKFGSLLTRGSHDIVSRITYNDQILQLCRIQVNVIVQHCSVPKYLTAHCNEHDISCNFTCRDPKLELLGESSSVCDNDNMMWENELPVCRARSWCYSPIPPEHGRISCKGNPMGNGAGLAEGSRCRLRCAQGWRPSPRGVNVCRRGVWTSNLLCQPRNRYPTD